MSNMPPLVKTTHREPPPRWALLQRKLISQMNAAAEAFVKRYTRPDGTLVWREEWPGMDGSDDAYESFWSFPLFYALGGSENVHRLSRRLWSAVTWQFTEYGQVHREFDAYYDWMHHGESSQYIYGFGLADPNVHIDRRRALRFADMYIGEDEEAPNWDPERRMIRSPINGSRGPRFHMTAEDWSTHRWILANYLSPYEDVPGLDPNDPNAKADWNDDAVFEQILSRMNERMVPGDIPLNLNATSLVASAYLYTGDPKYKRWVLDYIEAWAERTRANGGIMPDNIGPNGEIGERMGGNWWGGYYGWRWPHGARIILESTLIAGANALLLTGDESYLDLHRSQWDMLWELGREEDGAFKTPNRHGQVGWFNYISPDARYPTHCFALTHSAQDKARLDAAAPPESYARRTGFGKGAQAQPGPWLALSQGQNDDAPELMMDAACREVARRLDIMRNDDGDPNEWDVHHWQDINPVVCEPIAQLSLGSVGSVYHGGLLHATVRYFDAERRRPGLPPDAAAAVLRASSGEAEIEFVNANALEERQMIVQAGAFGEHAFTTAETNGEQTQVDGPCFRLKLAPMSRQRVRVGLKRYVHDPSYNRPWPS